jgi:quercetin 2,3-dioxygenase
LFLYISAGELSVNGQKLGQGDQARLNQKESLHLDTISSAEFVLIDIPASHEKFMK